MYSQQSRRQPLRNPGFARTRQAGYQDENRWSRGQGAARTIQISLELSARIRAFTAACWGSSGAQCGDLGPHERAMSLEQRQQDARLIVAAFLEVASDEMRGRAVVCAANQDRQAERKSHPRRPSSVGPDRTPGSRKPASARRAARCCAHADRRDIHVRARRQIAPRASALPRQAMLRGLPAAPARTQTRRRIPPAVRTLRCFR